MDKIFIGKICGYHGVKGELKVLSDFERKDLAFQVQKKILIGDGEHVITTHRTHQNNELITIDNLFTLNQVEKYIGENVYISRDELNLDTFLLTDLINFQVWEEKENLGVVISIYQNKAGYMLYIKNPLKNFYIPYQKHFIKEVNVEKKTITVSHGKELLLCE